MPNQTNGTETEIDAKVYRPSGFWQVALVITGIVFGAGAIVATWFASVGHIAPPSSRFLLIGVCVLLALGGAYCFLYTIKSKVVLFPDRISIEDLTRTRVIPRHQIRGWRILPTNPTCLVLEPSDITGRKAKIALTFPLDDDFEQWLDPLPCLDAEEESTSDEEITNDRRLGENPADRTAALARGRRLAKMLTVASMAVCGWAFLYPRPYVPAIVALIVLPWVAIEILRRSNGLFRVDERRNDAHPSVAIALMFPPLILAVRSVLDYNVLQSASSFLMYASIGGVLAFLAAKFDTTLWARKPIFAIFCVIGFAYGFGAVTEGNALLDRSPGTSYSATVEGKHVSHSKRTSYHLKLGPWGHETKPSDLEVSRATYDPIECGDVALLTLRRGAFGLNWYYLGAWQRGENPSPCK
jgi:hypothetical protein